MHVSNLNLYAANDNFDIKSRGLVAHVAQLLQAGETERIRGIVESLCWFNRSGYDELNRVFAPHIKSIMSREPAEVA